MHRFFHTHTHKRTKNIQAMPEEQHAEIGDYIWGALCHHGFCFLYILLRVVAYIANCRNRTIGKSILNMIIGGAANFLCASMCGLPKNPLYILVFRYLLRLGIYDDANVRQFIYITRYVVQHVVMRGISIGKCENVILFRMRWWQHAWSSHHDSMMMITCMRGEWFVWLNSSTFVYLNPKMYKVILYIYFVWLFHKTEPWVTELSAHLIYRHLHMFDDARRA